ncbi:MAG: beta-lactamase family protein [Clostridiales bacterium]|nr:beta-lactamase family protein [Clostridiales bacterium]
MNSIDSFSNTIHAAKETVDAGLVPSLCLSAGLRNHILVKECFGRTNIFEDGSPVNEKTIYDMASLTKLLGPTMIALRLMARGKLEITDTLPMFFGAAVPKDKQNISIYHLMTHTAGFLPSVRMDKLFTDSERVLPYLLGCPLQYEPGKCVAYSCLGYIVLGKILETLTGKTLDILADEEVFHPLGMLNTCYHPLNKKWPTENTAYTEHSSFENEWLVGKVHDENAYLLNGVSGNAGIFSTLEDCIRFARMLANCGKMDELEYLPKNVIMKAMEDQTAWAGNHKGIGFDLSGGWNSICGPFFADMAAGHTGFTGTTLYINPKNGAWVIILSNRVHPTRENTNMPRIRRIICNCFASDLAHWQNQFNREASENGENIN